MSLPGRGWAIAATVALSASALAQGPARTEGGSATPVVRAFVDRSAMWVGDRVTYSVEITSPRGYDVLDDDLSKDALKLDGLEVVSTEATRSEGPGGSATRRFEYVLTSYRFGPPSARVAPFSVRYYAVRAGQRLEDASPAGTMDVPGAIVAVRSLLPEEQALFELRDERSPSGRPAVFAMAGPVGLALLVVSVVPAVVWVTTLAGRRRRRATGPSVRRNRREQSASLDAVRGMSMETPDGRREAYTHIDLIVRQHLTDVAGIPGGSLTPSEVGAALAGRPLRLPAERVEALLLACETARYGPPQALQSAEACRDALAQAETLVGVR